MSRRELLIATLLVSAGVHAGLAPQHAGHSLVEAAGFGSATILLAIVALLVATRPSDSRPPRAAATLFAGLIAAYVLVRVGEPLDALGVATKAVEAVGLALALSLERSPGGRAPPARAVYLVYVAFGLLLSVEVGHAH